MNIKTTAVISLVALVTACTSSSKFINGTYLDEQQNSILILDSKSANEIIEKSIWSVQGYQEVENISTFYLGEMPLIVYNQEFINSLKPEEQDFAFFHELGHLHLNHRYRFNPNKNKFYHTINITNAKFTKDLSPINNTNLKQYSKAYLHHLFKTNEPLGMRLATLNNLEFYLTLMRQIRNAIKKGIL